MEDKIRLKRNGNFVLVDKEIWARNKVLSRKRRGVPVVALKSNLEALYAANRELYAGPPERLCSTCRVLKDITQFSITKTGVAEYRCLPCRRAYQQERYEVKLSRAPRLK